MAYAYITDNNLYEKQRYRYSEYRGAAFIKEYLKTRKSRIHSLKFPGGGGNLTAEKAAESATGRQLRDLLENLKNGTQVHGKSAMDLMNAYTKSFEVRKRIYTEYDGRFRPSEDAGFEDYKNYLLFLECLLQAYRQTGLLKYYSCLLKADDTMLSLWDRLSGQEQEALCRVLTQELDIFYQLAGSGEWEEAV